MTSRTTPLGGVHDDERMLDQLASRSYAGEDQLGLALNAWAKRMDAEASAATARADIGELVRRHTAAAETVEAVEPTTTIRIRASRLLATLGGVGVAATALGIALANGYNVPGFPTLTPSQSSSSVMTDQQMLNHAIEIQRVVLTNDLPKPEQIEKLQEIEELRKKVKDPAIQEKLQSVQAVVEQIVAKTTPSPTGQPSTSTSPTSLPTHLTLIPEVPPVMTTPAPETTPAPPEKATSSSVDKTTTKKPTDSSSTSGSIPADATTTPAPTTTPVPPPSTGTATQSSKPTLKSSSRTMPGRTPRRTATTRASSSAPASASAPVANVSGATGTVEAPTAPAEG